VRAQKSGLSDNREGAHGCEEVAVIYGRTGRRKRRLKKMNETEPNEKKRMFGEGPKCGKKKRRSSKGGEVR